MRTNGPIQRGDGQVLPGGEALGSFGTLPVNQSNGIRTTTLCPDRFGKAPLEDFRVLGRRATSLDRLSDVFQLTEVLLPNAPAFSVYPRSLRVVVIRVAVDLLGFQTFHALPPGLAARKRILGHIDIH